MKIYHAADIHLGRRRLDGRLPDYAQQQSPFPVRGMTARVQKPSPAAGGIYVQKRQQLFLLAP